MIFTLNKWIWLEHKREVYVPVKMISQSNNIITSTSSEGDVYEFSNTENYNEVHINSLNSNENMVTMSELSEAAILHNLRLRYKNNDIYTYISSILLSMNPYKMLPIYSPATIAKFRSLSLKREPLPPHVFSIADFAYSNLVSDNTNQSVVISGESGSGKTEATKLILQYLAECSGHGGQVEEQILEANPIIEAFGNSKTGKWIKIDFSNSHKICGAHIESYLLEKTRVVSQSYGERNYHIFYQFCAGASEEEKRLYQIDSADKFKYCSGGNAIVLEGVNDSKEYKLTRSAMNTLNFTKEEQAEIFYGLAAVMHLGNLEFVMKNDEESSIANPDCLQIVAKMMRVDPSLLEKSLITRKIKVVSELVVAFNNKTQAFDGRDALSKYIYDKVFEFLIYRINQTLSTGHASQAFIGVLDIFGFEMFETNRFEQLCINFANEKLQQHFNHHIFSMEQEEYKNDGVNIAQVEFIDNQACLDVIEKKPIGIFSMVDEEIRLPRGSDLNLLNRMHKEYEKNKYYIKPRTSNPIFTICHYAGEVPYIIEGFLDKNKDSLNDDVLSTIRSSSSSFISQLVGSLFSGPQVSSNVKKVSSPMAVSAVTVSSQFKDQLAGLMKTLNATNPQFVRCIKPNELKIADNYDANFVIRQLRYLGIKEVVNIRQLGYPVRKGHSEFFIRYKMLGKISNNLNDMVKSMMQEADLSESNYAIGRTKIFLKNLANSALEHSREKKISKLIIKLQACIRGWYAKRRYQRIKKVRDNLKVCLANPETNLEALESGIALANDMGISDPLINQARQVLARTKEVIHFKKSLTTAIASKDTTILKAAISRCHELKFDNTMNLFVSAVKLLKVLEDHDRDINIAIKSRELSALKAVLISAQNIGLMRDIEKQANSLVSRIEAENKSKCAVEAAVNSRDINSLKNSIASAADIGYEFELLNEARSLLAVLVEQKKVIESLNFAIQSQSLRNIEKAIQESKKCKSSPHIEELISKGTSLMGSLKAVAKEQEVAQSLQAAIDSVDISILDSCIKKSIEENFSSPLLSKAQALFAKLSNELIVEDLLSKALLARSLKLLETALVEAKTKGTTSTPSYSRAFTMAQTLQRIFGAISKSLRNNNLVDLENALGDALQAGLENTPEVIDAKKKKNALGDQKAILDSLQAALGERDENLLKSLIERAKAVGLTTSNLTYAKAISELGRIINAKADEKARKLREEAAKKASANDLILEERDLIEESRDMVFEIDERLGDLDFIAPRGAPRRSTVVTPMPNRPTFTFNLPPVNRSMPVKKVAARGRVSQYFNPANYSEDKFTLSLFPKLKTEDDYVKGKLFGRGALKATMLSWNKETIPNALTRLHETLESDALSMFKSLLGFMGDRHYSFPDTLASEILEKGLRNEAMRDEIYVQILKQMTFNGKPESLVRGWMMLGLTCETFCPSNVLLPYVLRFIKDHIDNEVGGIVVPLRKEYAKYCMKTLLKTFSNISRIDPPTIEHVTLFQSRVMLSNEVSVYFLDGSFLELEIDPATLVNQVIESICNEIDLTDSKGFGIYEVDKNKADRFISPTECLLDFDAAKKKDGSSMFVFKKRIFNKNVMPISVDPVCLSLVYHQAAYDIFTSNLLLRLPDTVELFAINAILESKQLVSYTTPRVDDKSPFVPRIAGLIPTSLKLSAKVSQASFTEMVKAKQSTLSNVTIKSYLDLIFKQLQFGCQFFTVEQDENKSFPNSMSVGVNRNGIHFVNWETKQLFASFGFDVISGWTDTPLLFVTRVFDKSKNKLETLCMKTPNGKLISNVLQDYVDMLMQEMKGGSSRTK